MIRRLLGAATVVTALVLSGCAAGSAPSPSPSTAPVVLEIGGLAGVSGDALTLLRTTPISGVEVQWLQYSDAPGMMSALGAGSNDAILVSAELMANIPHLEVLKVFEVTTANGGYTEVLAFSSASPEAEQLRRVAVELSTESTRAALTKAGYSVAPTS